jgi:caspase 7
MKMDHSENDCLVVVIMSHGENGFISATDHPLKISTIWNKFKGHESLIGKPKLFFVQACRGENVSREHEIPNHLEPDSRNRSITIPEFSDNLVMYSTDEDNISVREHQKGSWFIQELCNQLEKNLASDLLSTLIVVTRKIALKTGPIEIEGRFVNAKQLPIIMTSLTKKIYFFDKQLTSDGKQVVHIP